MKREFHSGFISRLAPREVFVFGSNTRGIHGAGAAKLARRFGAMLGVGIGPTGKCYALPTKSDTLSTLDIEAIRQHAQDFLAYAAVHPEQRFLLTAVGCGLAGYQPAQIAPLFAGAPPNVVFPPEFRPHADPSVERQLPASVLIRLTPSQQADPDVDEFAWVGERVLREEKPGVFADLSPELQSLMHTADWQTFSRPRGYTASEIENFARYMQLAEVLDARYGQGFSQGILFALERVVHPYVWPADSVTTLT